MAHTKGEWRASNHLVGVDSPKSVIAKCGMECGMSNKEKKANAKLIAAAPNMLDVLQDIFSQVNLADYSMKLYKNAEDTINKAIN